MNRTNRTYRQLTVPVTLVLALILFVGWQVSAAYGSTASAHPRQWSKSSDQQVAPPVTPQPPQPDGSIIHEVRPGDTLAGIALAYKVDIEELRRLNNIPPEVGNIYYGQKLVIKLAPVKTVPPNATFIIVTATNTLNGPAPAVTIIVATNAPAVTPTEDTGPILVTVTPVTTSAGTDSLTSATQEVTAPTATETPAPSDTPTEPPTPTELPPTATLVPIATNAVLCISAFNDMNTNHWRDGDEALLANVALTVKQGDKTVKEVKSAGDADTCFDDLQQGAYTIVAAAPDGYGLTTSGQLEVDVKAGAKTTLPVGAAMGYLPPVSDTSKEVAAVATSVPAPRTSLVETALSNSGIIVLVLAVLVLIGGLAVAFIARRA